MGPLLGFNQEQSADLSKKCELILGWEITKDVCYDFRQSRQWVMCRAWELMETERISFGDAMSMAWDGFKRKMQKSGRSSVSKEGKKFRDTFEKELKKSFEERILHEEKTKQKKESSDKEDHSIAKIANPTPTDPVKWQAYAVVDDSHDSEEYRRNPKIIDGAKKGRILILTLEQKLGKRIIEETGEKKFPILVSYCPHCSSTGWIVSS